MADITGLHDFAFEQVIPSSDFNDNFDEIETKFNASIASIINDSGYPAGAVALASVAGVPTMTTISGDGSLSGTGVFTLAAALKQTLGVSDGSTIRRGKSIIATEESRSNTAYGTLTTPDQVQNVVLPTDGLIFVAFSALVKCSGASTGLAALFIGANQVKVPNGTSGTPQVQEAFVNGTNAYNHIVSTGQGLIGHDGSPAHTGGITTGQIIGLENTIPGGDGGAMVIFADAGTYTISVQFRATSGSVTAKERKLWVWTMGF